MNIKISIHPNQYQSKPEKAEIQRALSRSFEPKETTIQGLKDYISNGHTIAPAIFENNHRANRNFISSQAIFLDYDDNQDPKEIIEQIEEFGFKVNIFYNSFSHTPEYNKFRLVIVLDTVIEDSTLFKAIVTSFIKLTGADAGCKDLSRMYFAGFNTKVLNNEPNDYTKVSGAFIDLINANKTRQNYKRTVKRVNAAKNDSKSTFLYKYNGIVENESKIARKLQVFDFQTACDNSEVFDGFDKCTIHLKYAQLRALVSNMMFVEGGMKWVKDRMAKRGDYVNTDWALAYRLPNYDYNHAEGMFSFDPSIQDDYRNILALDEKKRDAVVQIRELNKQPVDKVSLKMHEHFNNALRSKNLTSIIKAPTSIGKTELIIKLEDGLIAVPTHDLKDELAERMEELGLPYVITPRPPVFETEELNKKYAILQDMEESKLASTLITTIAEGKEIADVEYTDVDINVASEYKRDLTIAYESDVMVITTHSRALLTPFLFQNKNKLVFDEDIIHQLIDRSTCKFTYVWSKLDTLLRTSKEGTEFNNDVKEVIKEVRRLENGEIGYLDLTISYQNRVGFFMNLASRQGYNKLAKFLTSSKSIRLVDDKDITTYNYGNLRKLSDNFEKILIFSATASKQKYDYYFQSIRWEYDFFDSGLAVNTGVVKQNLSKSYSRTQLNKGLRPEVESNTVITYKKFINDFEGNENEDIYFGNTEGKNTLKGKDTSIVGLNIKPVNTTVMECILLGLDYGDTHKDFVTVTNEYYSYQFFTFVDENLRNIEMSSAESELEQSSGRSRALRTNAKVDIHTSLPIPSVDEFSGKPIIKCIDKDLPSLSTEFIAKEDFDMWFDISEAERKAPPKEHDEQISINFAS